MQRLLDSPEFVVVSRSLREIGFNSAASLLSTFGGHARDLKPWLRDAQVNTDRNLRLQFLAGFNLNANEAADTYRGILAVRQYPEDLFAGTPPTLQLLRTMTLGRQH
jgi:spermidine synthase